MSKIKLTSYTVTLMFTFNTHMVLVKVYVNV